MREVLSSRGTPYQYYELHTQDDLDAFAAKTNMLGLPVLVIDGDPLLAKDIQKVEQMLRNLRNE